MSRNSPAKRPSHLNLGQGYRSAFTPVNGVYSPVTDLTINLNELSTSFESTPRRRLLTPEDGLTKRPLHTQLSQDSGVSMGSPSPDDMDTSSIQKRSYLKSSALRRLQSMPAPFFGLDTLESTSSDEACADEDDEVVFTLSPRRPTPVIPGTTDDNASPGSPLNHVSICGTDDADDDNSRDSGVSMDTESRDKLLECDFRFAEPVGLPPPRRLRLSEEVRSPLRQLSLDQQGRTRPRKSLVLSFSPCEEPESPVKLRRSSLTSSDDQDDGFLELVDEDCEVKKCIPNSMAGLFTAPISTPDNITPFRKSHVTRLFASDNEESPFTELLTKDKSKLCGSSRRGLFKSPSAPRLCQRTSSFKRSEPCPDETTTPNFIKRRKSIVESPMMRQEPELSKPRLERCHSASEAMIKSALNALETDPNMIGDCSKTHCLPVIPGKHSDLKSITADTLSSVINNEYDDVIERTVIVDCRYPYEYEGGHIKGALNLYTKRDILDEFIQSDGHLKYQSKDANKRTVIIFHCEFSSERGPKMSRFLRNVDREHNKEHYPHLHYPEIYLLHNGYKEFFHTHQEQCFPMTYKPMLHEDHSEDYRKFRAKTKSSESQVKKLRCKAKSWAGDRPRVPLRPGLKDLL